LELPEDVLTSGPRGLIILKLQLAVSLPPGRVLFTFLDFNEARGVQIWPAPLEGYYLREFKMQ